MFKYELGVQVRDIVTKSVGITLCREEWLNGCIRYGTQAEMDKDGNVPELRWIDEGQLELIEVKVTVKKKRTGGPSIDKPSPMSH